MIKKTLFFLGLIFLGTSYGQVSSDVTPNNFKKILTDKEIKLNWNEVQAFSNKAKQRHEDVIAVYSHYMESLERSELNSSKDIKAILEKEIEAVKLIINKK